MSAVTAVLDRTGAPVPRPSLQAMLDASPHRGLDGSGTWVDGPVAVGYQHLSRGERDPSVPGQPLVDQTTGLVVSCDARLERRQELAAAVGLRPGRDSSDADLIRAAYERWGVGCVEQLRGDFAFILFDRRRRLLLAGRDALGVRDLCFAVDHQLCLVASEIAQVVAHPYVERRIHEGRVAEYLANHWHNHSETVFSGVQYCPPGHCLTVSSTGFRLWRHWHPVPVSDRTTTDGESAERFEELLRRAVADRVRDGGPVAVSLSGGPDSAALAAMLTEEQPTRPVRSFSYVFDRYPSCDERASIAASVAAHQLRPTLLIGDQLWPLRDLATWPVFHDFPSQDAFVRLPLAVAEAAKQDGVRLLFNGHFSDVLFDGGRFWAADLLRAGRPGATLRLWATRGSGARLGDDILRRGVWPLGPSWLHTAAARVRSDPDPGQGGMLTEQLCRRTDLADRVAVPRPPDGWSVDRFHRLRHLTMSAGPIGASISRRIYNSRGMELVDPYWDRGLVEHVLAEPAHRLRRPPWSKWLLRRAMAGRVPPEVLWRRDKTSLLALFEAGLLDKARSDVRERLTDARFVGRGWVRRDWLQRELDAGGGWTDNGYPLWRCLTVEMWLRQGWDEARAERCSGGVVARRPEEEYARW